MSQVPTGNVAYEIAPPATQYAPLENYTIEPGDTLNVQVFQEPDLSIASLKVDDAGNIQLPLVNQIKAAGISPETLSNRIADILRQGYVRDPQVSVSLVQTQARRVAVEGAVEKPGVYELNQNSSLLSAMAQAGSPTNTAKLDEIVLFRTIDGRRAAARFNLKDIRAGIAEDPRILDGDTIVVGFSSIAQAWQDILKASPLFSTFVFAATRW